MKKLFLFFTFLTVINLNSQKLTKSTELPEQKLSLHHRSNKRQKPHKLENLLLVRLSILAVAVGLGNRTRNLVDPLSPQCLQALPIPGFLAQCIPSDTIGNLAGNYVASLTANILAQTYNTYRHGKKQAPQNLADAVGAYSDIQLIKPMLNQILPTFQNTMLLAKPHSCQHCA
jgi:hypothetical protein